MTSTEYTPTTYLDFKRHALVTAVRSIAEKVCSWDLEIIHDDAVERNLVVKGRHGNVWFRCAAYRDGPCVSGNKFFVKKMDKLPQMILTELIASEPSGKVPSEFFPNNAALRKAVGKLCVDGFDFHPTILEAAEKLKEQIKTLLTPAQLHMNDMRPYLLLALSKGASRDDLIQMIDEAITESVMGS